jgi:hypothetical protein
VAYAYTTTVTTKVVNGRRHFHVKIVETDVANTDIAQAEDLPAFCRLLKISQLESAAGGATTTQPRIAGNLENTTEINARGGGWTGSSATTLATAEPKGWQNQPGTVGFCLYLPDGILYLKSNPNSSGSGITTELYLVEGWHL